MFNQQPSRFSQMSYYKAPVIKGSLATHQIVFFEVLKNHGAFLNNYLAYSLQ